MTKSELRKSYLVKRSKISSHDRQAAAHNAAEIFANLPLFKQSKHIACYLSFKNEFDTSRIIEVIWQAKKNCYLPILYHPEVNNAEKSLLFIPYQDGDALHLNRHAILEPVKTKNQIAAKDLDIVLTPLVAFDLNGHRLGMGVGYYDRTFAFLHASNTNKPQLIGLAFKEQQVDSLPSDPWDIPLNGIITENEFISF